MAECLLPGLTEGTAAALTQRLRDELNQPGRPPISFLGSLLMLQDEVLLCIFAAGLAEVSALCERAGLPFERIVGCVGLGWRAARTD